MFRRKIYKWHRTLSLVTALPVVLWALSGFMHPLMTNIRPNVARQFLPPQVVDSSQLQMPLQTVLERNTIATVYNLRLVPVGTNWFYQVRRAAGAVPLYFSTKTGRRLPNGDVLYARYLAQRFLGEAKEMPQAPAPQQMSPLAVMDVQAPRHDCCEEATAFVEKATGGYQVASVERVDGFTPEYKYVNRLLPVYRVAFARADGIRIYVETTTDRFAYAVDNKRAAFDGFFAFFHTWGWMDGLGKAKYVVMIILLSTALLTTFMGLYIFFTTKGKPANGKAVMKARRSHRLTSVTVSLFTILFAFSGAFHAWAKLTEKDPGKTYTPPTVNTASLNLNFSRLQSIVRQPITDIRLAIMGEKHYWQVFTKNTGKAATPTLVRNDLMKDKEAPPPNAIYVDSDSYIILPAGERVYSNYLAAQYSSRSINDSASVDAITRFEGEYGFVNKRLPVWRVSYANEGHERYYIETSTGALATRVEDKDLTEGYSFALLHKHHFMDWAGKGVRDFSTMFWAAAQIVMVTVGLVLWQRVRKKNRQ